ncbi:hypothetical protein JCM10207_002528 [Rhodosporidiobolus poonsookiae]
MAGRPICWHDGRPGGCNNPACPFTHTRPRPSLYSSPSSPAQTPNPTQRARFAGVPRRAQGGAPSRPTPSAQPHPAPARSKQLSVADLTALASGSSDVLAGETTGAGVDHRFLEMVLREDSTYRFQGAPQMYKFLNALLKSSKESATWSNQDASNILIRLGTLGRPGLARLAEIVNTPISTRAGSNPNVLSFQRGFMALVMYMTSNVVKNSHLARRVPF